MTLNVEEGFHKGTLISCVLIATFGIMFAMMLAPNTPYLIRMYLPNVDILYWTKIAAVRWRSWNLYWNFHCCFLCGNDSRSSHVGTNFWFVWKKTCHGCNIDMYEFVILTNWQGNVFCIVIFSFSTNYVASVIIRLIHGLLDGVLPIVTAIVSEISNERNIALGTSSIFVGVAIGGFAYFEIESYSDQ